MKRRRLLAGLVTPLLILLSFTTTFAQTKIISGKVTDSKDGSPLAGVSVIPKGSVKGTTTGADGVFHLTIDPQTTTLVFSSIGFGMQEVHIGNADLNVKLTQTNNTLGEIVVVGYGTVKRKELTGSIAVVNAKDFQQGTITTPEQLIAGKVAGVSITSNGGSPGSGSTIRIRGGASLNASNDPLIVIDGVPLSNDGINGVASPLSLVNSDDIETFTVLKDAASTAIYGSRASNGVILITTKHGKSGKGIFNFSTSFSAGHIIKEVPVMNAATFRSFIDSLAQNHSELVNAPVDSALGNSNTDWQKQIYQTAIASNNNISYTGSAKNTPYRLSFNFLDQNGILKTDNLQRVTATISVSPHFFDNHLKLEFNLHGSYTKSRFANTAAIGDAISFDPTQPVFAVNKGLSGNPYFGWYNNSPKGSSTGGDTILFNTVAGKNPVEDLMRTINTGNVYRGFGNVQLDYKLHFLPDLHLVANWGFDVSKGNTNNFTYSNTFDNLLGNNNPGKQTTNNQTVQYYLNYIKDIKSIKSSINATLGSEYQNFYSSYVGEYNFYANGDTIPNTKPLYPTYPNEHTILSYYGRLVYSYDSKYILAASAREDGSSRFGPLNAKIGQANRWSFFPSIALTWRINQEDFLKNSNLFSDLKLRGSYGVTGNQDGLGNYLYNPVYVSGNVGTQYIFGNTSYYTYNPQYYLSNLIWEQTATWNLGLDYGFLNNRISGAIDLYDRKTKNLFTQTNLAGGSNYTNNGNVNLGDMQSKGVEVLLNFIAISNRDFKWELSLNGAYDKHTITNLTFPGLSNTVGSLTGALPVFMSPNSQINAVGQSPYSYYLYKQIYAPNGKPIEGLYADLNRDGAITSADQTIYKNPIPKLILGFSTQASYKKWTISTVLRANFGNYDYNVVNANMAIAGNALNKGFLQNVPTSYFKTQFLNNEFLSNYYVENASFLKMDNLGIAYYVGKLVNNKVDLRVSVNCQNVFTITKYSGLDPEVYGGLDNNIYPRPRTFTLSLNLTY